MEELAARFEALLRETHDGTLGAINQTKAENSELDIMGRIEPPIFKGGKTDDLQEFFTRFEGLARLQNWSPDRQAQAQPLYLKGNALTWLTIPTQNCKTKTGPTGGEAGHEDIEVGRQRLAVFLFGVVHFHAVKVLTYRMSFWSLSKNSWKAWGSVNSRTCILFWRWPNLPHMELSIILARVRRPGLCCTWS